MTGTAFRAATLLMLTATLGACVSDSQRSGSTRTVPAASYTVRTGDTLTAIAGRLGVDMRTLARLNGLKPPYIIRVGQRLALPRGRAATPGRFESRPVVQPVPRATAPAPLPPIPPLGSPRVPSPGAAMTVPRLPAPLPGAPRLVWPADGPVTDEAAGGSDRQGLSIAAHRGTAVRSAAAGTVLSITDDPRYGRMVLVDHGTGWVTAYGHLGQLVVGTGERVAANARLGFVGPPAPGAAARLHFELRYGGRSYDPLPLLPPRF